MHEQALSVLVVSDDRKLLRHVSRFLDVFGFVVRQAAGVQQARAALESRRPDFLIVDARLPGHAGLKLCRRASAMDRNSYVYKFLLVGSSEPHDLTEALEAGVDDFLTDPFVHGEVLVRLRAGARVLEYERRARQQASRDLLTGCSSRSDLIDRMPAGETDGRPDATACIAVDIDAFERINLHHGQASGDRIIQEVARTLKELRHGDETVAALGGARFAVLLPGVSVAKASRWAEQARNAIEQTEFMVGETTIRLTASVGVATLQAGVTTGQPLLEAALLAMRTAKSSGRNCVVHYGQFDDEARSWEELAAPGKLFEQTVARDVMIPSTIVLQSDDPLSTAATVFHGTRLGAIPVVDTEGRLAGLLSPGDVPDGVPGRVGDVMARTIATLDEEASFDAIMECFHREAAPWIVILSSGQPVGLVAPNQLASVTEPLTTATFAPTTRFSLESDYLRVLETGMVDQA